MKRISLLIVMISCLSSMTLLAQSVLYMNQILDPIPGHAVDLEKGTKAHNAKYHASGDATASLFAILTGPRAGQYAWVQGPMTYATLDKALSNEHAMDWDKNVASFCRTNGQTRIVKRDEALSYSPANEVPADNYLARVFYGVSNPGQLKEAMGMIQKVYEANKTPKARRVYTSEFRGKDEESLVLVYPFSSFTEFEKVKGLAFEDLPKELNKVHGPDGAKKFNELTSSSSAGWYDEIRTMVK